MSGFLLYYCSLLFDIQMVREHWLQQSDTLRQAGYISRNIDSFVGILCFNNAITWRVCHINDIRDFVLFDYLLESSVMARSCQVSL
mgnify:CR=1 FL=1